MEITSTKRAYTGLEDYAQAHHSSAAVFTAAGWSGSTTRRNRPALEFKTTSGPRWRFIDGDKPTYDQNPGYKACWYGLKRAMTLQPPLFECNGAASTIPAQAKGVAAFSVQGGEGLSLSTRQYLIDELKATGYTGIIYVVYDCDETGRKAAVKRVQEYRKAGFQAEALDLALGIDGGDLADFMAQHDNPVDALLACKRLLIPATEDKPQRKTVFTGSDQDKAETAQKALDLLNPADYDTWFRVGCAIKDGFGESGFAMWDSWSARAENYNAKIMPTHWRSYKIRADGIKFGTLIDMADKVFGGDAWRVKPKLAVRSDSVKTTQPENVWQGGLPDAVRAALNLYAPAGTSAVLNVWVDAIACGFLEWDEPVDVPYLKCVFDAMGVKLSTHLIRSVTNPDAVQFVKKMSHYSISIPYLDLGGNTIKWDKILTNRCGCENPVKAGRKAALFTLKSPDQIIADISTLAILPILEKAFPADSDIVAPINTEFLKNLDCAPADAERIAAELDERYGDLLKAQPGYKFAMNRARKEFRRLKTSLLSTKSVTVPLTYKNASEYTALFARALIASEGGETQYSREVLCSRIGTVDRMLPKVFKAGGLVMLKHQTVDAPLANMAAVNALRNEYSVEHKGFPVALVSSRTPEKAFSLSIAREKRIAWAKTDLEAGATLSVRYRQANRQVLAEKHAEPESMPAPAASTPKAPVQLAIVTTWLRYVRQMIAAKLLYVLTAWEHFAQLVSMFVTWVRRDTRKKPRKPVPKSYPEKWLDGLAAVALPPEVREVGLVNRDGEVLDATPQNVIEVLRDPPEVVANSLQPVDEWHDLDDLLVDMVAAGGVIAEVIEYQAEAA